MALTVSSKPALLIPLADLDGSNGFSRLLKKPGARDGFPICRV